MTPTSLLSARSVTQDGHQNVEVKTTSVELPHVLTHARTDKCNFSIMIRVDVCAVADDLYQEILLKLSDLDVQVSFLGLSMCLYSNA